MTISTDNMKLQEQAVIKIADALAQQGFIHLQGFLPEDLAQQLMLEAKRLASIAFRPAGIGRDSSKQLDLHTRTDATLWFDGQSAVQQAYLGWMEQLRAGLNRRLFMGLTDFECHYSHYAVGDFYHRHLDAFKEASQPKRSNRALSTVFYLNPNWGKEEGGELLLYADESVSPLLIVPPQFNDCIIFLSDEFPHEVLTSRRDRYSIAGWYRQN